ncbi:SpaA isopeptide-forming pilin-related protein, partial [uncultured Oscillibacter sp.]|uniref:SpaA isopeptide-forming pilin-related protein n=1 Tax=uncultured Oscillibacter sp. TaxID=876091 RepID=UPI0025F470F3
GGQIVLSKLLPGTYVVSEVKAPDNYQADPTPQTVVVNAGDTQTLRFYDDPLCTLTILKRDAVTQKPLKGAEFTVKDSEGRNIGRYTTGTDGTVTVSGLTPNGTYVVSETKAPTGYIKDETPKNIVVRSGVANSLIFDNEPATTLIIRKFIEGTENEPLSGVAFKVVDGNGGAIGPDDGIYYTDKAGEIIVEGLEPGTTVKVREIKTVEGYVLDGTPQDILIKAGEAQQLTFWNKRAGTLVIQKKDSVTGALIAGAQFQVTYANGGYVDNDNGHLSSNGLYTTDDKGEIRISGITGTVVVKETKPAPGYVIDQSTQTQTVTVNPLDTQTLTFLNEPLCSLTLTKLDSVTGKPIPGTEFTVKDGNGTVLGRYTTGKDGTVVVTGLVPGSTVVVTETKVPDGYVLNPTPQTIIVKNGSNSVNSGTVGGTTNGNTGGSTNVGGGTNGGNDLVFENDPIGTFELIKVVEGNKEKRIPNVTFEIRRASDDALVETVTTGSDGRVSLKLDAGDYYAVETEAAKGFKLDATRHYFTMKNGKNTTLTVENKPFSGILIHKTDSVTGKGIQGVTFLLYDSANTPIGQYTSDNSGYVYIENLTVSGRYYLRELENEGYVPDTLMKTVYVTAGETTLIEWKNIPITAQIQIVKKSADYNSTNGLPAGTLLEGAVFEIYDKAGNLVDTIKSDQRGLASSKPLPLGRYTIRETKAPANYGVSGQELTAYLEHEGQILRFEVTNKSLTTGVSITKTGPREAMAGQPVNYVLSGIANNSNVMLQSFYWRDTLPAQVRLNTIVTGTYNFPGVYKITYRVNGGEYRTLADNLSTQKNYTLQASPAALGLAANERVTEVMFVFGQAPAGFAQVEKPQIKCTAVAGLTAGSSFVNIADVGGVYNGVWVQAISRWVTTVYGKPTPLPKTGY